MKKPRMILTITPDGGKVYGLMDGGFDVSSIGKKAYSRRVSDVEYDTDRDGWVIFSRVTMQFIGRRVFKTRNEAVEYEKDYMNRRLKKVARYAGVL